MLEAVGAEYYNEYFKKCSKLLKKDGIFAIQVITCPDSRFESLKNGVDSVSYTHLDVYKRQTLYLV